MTLTLVTGETAPIVFDIYDQWIVDPRFEVIRLDANRQLEQLIINTMPRPVSGVIGQMSFAQISAQGNEVRIAGLNAPDPPKIGCANGPSAPGSKSWFKHFGYNNCYNYANDVLNDDEWSQSALPGTLTKMPSSTVTAQVKSILRAAILEDGLTKVSGDKVPAACPALKKHYIAVILRHHPGSAIVHDFHCFLLDTDGRGRIKTCRASRGTPTIPAPSRTRATSSPT